MGIFEIILLCFGGLIALIFIVGFFLPKKVRVERAVFIEAEPEVIFPHVNDLKQFIVWSPWTERDPNATYTFSDNTSGTGAFYHWKGNKKVGEGKMTILSSIEYKKVETELEFGKGKHAAKGGFILEKKNGETKVVWSFESYLGMNPISRYFGLFMDRFIGPDFEHGLNKLKAKVEDK